MDMLFPHSQLDYILFIAGLSFPLLAAACMNVKLRGNHHLPWELLAGFGIVQWTNQWCDLLLLGLGDAHSLLLVKFFLCSISFVLLLEFGRAGKIALQGIGPKRWIIIPLLMLVGLGETAGLTGVTASSFYILGLVGGCCTVITLVRYRGKCYPTNTWLLIAAIALGAYTLVVGAGVPKASFYPASFLNAELIQNACGLPIQVIQGLFVVLAAVAIWRHDRTTQEDAVAEVPDGSKPGFRLG